MARRGVYTPGFPVFFTPMEFTRSEPEMDRENNSMDSDMQNQEASHMSVSNTYELAYHVSFSASQSHL